VSAGIFPLAEIIATDANLKNGNKEDFCFGEGALDFIVERLRFADAATLGSADYDLHRFAL